MSTKTFIDFAYLAASVLFILGLKGLASPEKARRGIIYAEIGMLLAVVGTLLHKDIISYEWIFAGILLGAAIGAPMAIFMPMTAMPQRIALSHAFGALAASLVGIAKYYHYAPNIPPYIMAALSFEVLFGALTFTGSLMAFGKLQELITGVPIVYKGQNVMNISLFGIAAAIGIYLVFNPANSFLFITLFLVSLALGVLFVLPIGGADMPTVISLLNSYAGLAGAATGFVLHNNVLIIAGALDGTSGFLLSVIMCKAMNRSFSNVIFGAFGQVAAPAPEAAAKQQATVRSGTPGDAAEIFRAAKLVIVVPGYGMAVAQAQHAVRELAELMEKNGTAVKYAIHPVAGRMPGHMNVLLAEANVPYDQLLDMDDINPEFEHADVSLVIGANDVVNPAAKTDPSSPIYGMPILDVEKSKTVIVLKRSMNPGFAGIDNALFIQPNTMMVFGDAKGTLTKMAEELKKL
ncbi:MAG: NAD(P)(+) transhydrogenase (Re/Si-specific) subunit beta [Nitrospirae bacterium]|nr:NAD(P)(+) transhydrogenase (Re/Si-specific) subunit beta [Candidatus Manganitrophaceae bacterium]